MYTEAILKKRNIVSSTASRFPGVMHRTGGGAFRPPNPVFLSCTCLSSFLYLDVPVLDNLEGFDGKPVRVIV